MSAGVSIRLPNEIIAKIFSYLSSEERLRIHKNTANEVLQSILTCIRTVDFCQEECTALAKEFKVFLFAHHHLASMCLNHCSSPFPVLKTSLSNWSTLTELHVKNCGFPLKGVKMVLLDLKSLQSFSWSLLQTPCRDFNSFWNNQMPVSTSIKILDLDGSLFCGFTLKIMFKLFSNVIQLRINMYAETCQDSPYCFRGDVEDFEFSRLHSCSINVVGPVRIYEQPFLDSTLHRYQVMIDNIMLYRSKSLKWKDLEIWDTNGFHLGEDWPRNRRSLCIPAQNFKTINEGEFLDKIFTDYAGDHLTYLVMMNCKFYSALPRFPQFLQRLIISSINLKEINLSGTHLAVNLTSGSQEDHILYIISQVHGLQRLAIPGCYVFNGSEEAQPSCSFTAKRRKLDGSNLWEETEMECQPVRRTAVLQMLADSCPLLVELEIESQGLTRNQFLDSPKCETCSGSSGKYLLRDSDMMPILRMSRLENLTLKGQQGVVKSDFLVSIDKKCPRIRTLRLDHLGPNGQCLYLNRLFEALPKMSCLAELSLEHNHFPLDKPAFWQGLSKLESLKRLCIISQFTESLKPDLIIKFLLSAKNLKTFHVHCRARNFKTCASQVSSAMKKNPMLKNRAPLDCVIENYGAIIFTKPVPNYAGNVYECLRLCHKVSTVGIPIQGCGLLHK